MKIVVSPTAAADLEGIFAHTLENWGSDQASRYSDLLVARFKWLTANRTHRVPPPLFRQDCLARGPKTVVTRQPSADSGHLFET